MASDKFFSMYKGFVILRDNPYLPIAVKKIQKATRNLQLWKFYLIRKYGQRKSFSFGKFPKTYFRKSPIIFSRNILSRKIATLEFKEGILEILANRNEFSKITGYGHFSSKTPQAPCLQGCSQLVFLSTQRNYRFKRCFKKHFQYWHINKILNK